MKTNIIPTLPSKELTTASRYFDCSAHNHVNCEILFIVKGKIINTVNDISILAQPGSVFFINNLVTHSLKQTEDVYEHRDVYISSKRINEICNNFFDENFYHFLMRTDKCIQIDLPFDSFNSFLDRLVKNQTLYTLNKSKRELIKNSNLNIVVSLLGILYETTFIHNFSENDWLSAFLAKIQSPKYFTLPIGQIIKKSGYSASYFSHQFTKKYNMSFKTYITKLRINYTKFLLSSSDLSIADIALDCGFSHQSHFTQIFKSVVGVTPLKYRQTKIKYDNKLSQNV